MNKIIMQPGIIYRPKYTPSIEDIANELLHFAYEHENSNLEGHDEDCKIKCSILFMGSMRQIKLQNSNKEATCDDDKYELLCQWTWFLDKDGYAVRFTTSKGKRLTMGMHRMLVKGEEVDHIDGDKLNNRLSNLRALTHQQNIYNNRAHRDGSSIYKGVSRRGNRWRAQITKNGQKIMLGNFPEERYAAYAYDIAARDLFGQHAHLNFPSAYSSVMSANALPVDPQLSV